MPDRYTHAMIASGLALLPLYAGLSQAITWYFIAAVVFMACFLFYIYGQLGGGDVKLFTALALLLPSYPVSLARFGLQPVVAPYPFVLSVFFASAVFAMLVVSVGYALRLVADRRRVKGFGAKALKGIAYSAMTLPLTALWFYINPRMLIIALPLVAGAFVLAFKDEILRLYVAKKKSVARLNDDDVIALELLPKGTLKKLGLDGRKTFLASELSVIKSNARKHGIKEVLVSEYLPKFGPFILLSLVLNLMVGDTLLWLLMS
jgi:Flp pilus assembly protein protease CpaA